MSLWEREKSAKSWLAVALVLCVQWDAQPRIDYTGLVQKGPGYLGRIARLSLFTC